MSDLIAELRRSAAGDDRRLAELLGTLRPAARPGTLVPRASRELAAFLSAAATEGVVVAAPPASPLPQRGSDLVVELGPVPAQRARGRLGWLRALVPATLWAKAVLAATVAVAAVAVAGAPPSDDVVVRPATQRPAPSAHPEEPGEPTMHPGAVGGSGGTRSITSGRERSTAAAQPVRPHPDRGATSTAPAARSGDDATDSHHGSDGRDDSSSDDSATTGGSDDGTDAQSSTDTSDDGDSATDSTDSTDGSDSTDSTDSTDATPSPTASSQQSGSTGDGSTGSDSSTSSD